ncbi:MAG TPA: PaaI family thioesterase, partial [Blastocatellia bacterium]|nr:PaaI family thioesterase [Blastocatellia bacterium]
MNNTENEKLQELFRSAPFIADLGMELGSLGAGQCITSLTIESRHLQQNGFVHAGVLAAMADHSAGAAAFTLVGEGSYVLTAEFKVSLLRAARGERLRCQS